MFRPYRSHSDWKRLAADERSDVAMAEALLRRPCNYCSVLIYFRTIKKEFEVEIDNFFFSESKVARSQGVELTLLSEPQTHTIRRTIPF